MQVYIIIDGKNRERAGIVVSNINLIISATQKGVTPLKIVETETSRMTPFKTNTLRPIGGVIKLISVTTTTNMPNHIRSKPNWWTKGANMGTVNKIIDIDSNTQPKRR